MWFSTFCCCWKGNWAVCLLAYLSKGMKSVIGDPWARLPLKCCAKSSWRWKAAGMAAAEAEEVMSPLNETAESSVIINIKQRLLFISNYMDWIIRTKTVGTAATEVDVDWRTGKRADVVNCCCCDWPPTAVAAMVVRLCSIAFHLFCSTWLRLLLLRTDDEAVIIFWSLDFFLLFLLVSSFS